MSVMVLRYFVLSVLYFESFVEVQSSKKKVRF